MTATLKKKYKSPRQLQRQSNILATVRAMLEEAGYDGLTMRALAKRAGVAQGTLYNIYGSKDGLVLAAVDDLLVQMAGTATREATEQGIDAILTVGKVIGQQVQATPKFVDAMTRILFHIQPDDPLVEVVFGRSYPFLRSQLEIAQGRGDLRPEVDMDKVARHLVGQTWGVMLLWMMGMIPLEDDSKERRRSQLMTLIGIAKGPARKRLRAELAVLDKT